MSALHPPSDLPADVPPGGLRPAPRPWFQGLVAVLVLLAGALGAAWIVRSAPQPDRGGDLPGPRPVPVETQQLEVTQIPRLIPATGTLEAAEEAILASEVGGRVVHVAEGLRDGRVFGEGDILLRVDTSSLDAEITAQETAVELSQARLAAAEADLEGAARSLASLNERRDLLRSEEDRWIGLAERGRAEQARIDMARGLRLAAEAAASDAERGLEAIRSSITAAGLEIRLAQNRCELLEAQRTKATIRAPFPGRLAAESAPTVGSMLAPMVPIGSWLDRRALRLVTEVHEDDLAALSTRSLALAAPLSRPGAILEGRVTSLGARVDPLTRSVRVEALFPIEASADRGSHGLIPAAVEIPSGTFAQVELRGEPFRRVIWVPESWLTYRDGQAVAFVVVPGVGESGPVAELRQVEFLSGIHEGGRVIASGLAEGDEIITSSLQLLADGAPVQPAAEPITEPTVEPSEKGGKR